MSAHVHKDAKIYQLNHLEMKGTTSFCRNAKCNYDLTEDREYYQVHLPRKACLETAWIYFNFLKLWLSRLHLVSMKNSGKKLLSHAQIRKERDQAEMLSEKTLLYIDTNANSFYLSSSTATKRSY